MNWLLLKNSLLTGAFATLIATSIGWLGAMFACSTTPRWRKLWMALAACSLVMPPFLVTNSWLDLLGPNGAWRGWIGLDILSLTGAVLILSLLTWPIGFFLALGSVQSLDPALLESDPRVRGTRLIGSLIWPLSKPALILALTITFALTLNNFAVPAILQVKVFPAEMWVRFNTMFDAPGALRLSWPLALAPIAALIFLPRQKWVWSMREGNLPSGLFRQQLGMSWTLAGGVVLAAALALSLVLPFFQLISAHRTWTELPQALAAGTNALWNSLWLSGTAAVGVVLGCAVIFGLRLASRHSRLPASVAWTVGPLLWVAFFLPGVLLGIGLLTIFNRPVFDAFYHSPAIVILAFAVRYGALAWFLFSYAASSADPAVGEAARLDGASRGLILRKIYWPWLMPAASASAYIIYLLCLWDVESMILINPPGGETVALRIFNLLHYGHNAQVNALCLAIVGLAILPLLLWKSGTAIARWKHFPLRSATGFALTIILFLSAGCRQSVSPGASELHSQIFSGVKVIGSRGVGVGQLNKPRSVAVDREDNLFVVDMTGRVQKFSPGGAYLLAWQMPQTDLGKPKGLARDRQGNIVVVEPHYQRINHFTPSGKLTAQWGQRGTNAGLLSMPRSIAINSHDEAFVSEYGVVERVQKFQLSALSDAPALSARFIATSGQMGSAPGEFNRPEGLCLDRQDRLYVADSCNHRIQVFNADGSLLRVYGKAGSGKGELSYPYDICVDDAGFQFVCEFGNSRIQVFDAQGQSVETIGGPGYEPGQFSNPWGVALDSAGNLYVADSQNHRVQKLMRRGKNAGNPPPHVGGYAAGR